MKAMTGNRAWILTALAVLGACSDRSAPPSTGGGTTEPEETAVVVQAVDAGTGSALADEELTVRYLVRTPITLDAADSRSIPATRPYRIAHDVARDSLVVEVRLEADSYYRLDTVFAVPRGATAGPLTVRMARRLDRVAGSGRSGPDPGAGRPATGGAPPSTSGGDAPQGGLESRPAAAGTPSATTTPSRTPPEAADADVDLRPLREGDRAYERGDWVAATVAYERMPSPSDSSSGYGRSYERALTRKGVAHINLGEWGSALDALDRASEFEAAGATTFYHLGRSECAVGRIDAGRRSLDRVAARSSTIPPGDRAEMLALVDYQRAICGQMEFDRAEDTARLVRLGAQVVRDFEDFIETAGNVRPGSPELEEAVRDSRSRIEEVRARLSRLGRG